MTESRVERNRTQRHKQANKTSKQTNALAYLRDEVEGVDAVVPVRHRVEVAERADDDDEDDQPARREDSSEVCPLNYGTASTVSPGEYSSTE